MIKIVYLFITIIFGFTINAMQKRETENELPETIKIIIKKELTPYEAINALRELETNLQFEPLFQDYEFMQVLFSKLSERYLYTVEWFESVWDNSQSVIKQDYQVPIGSAWELQNLNKHFINDLVQKIKKANKRKEYLPFIFKLKRFREKNEALFTEPQIQELLKPMFERIDEVDFDHLVKLFKMQDKIKEWRNLEGDLIAAVIENNLPKVKELVEKYKVNREAPLLNMRDVKSDFCDHKFRYRANCQFYPICYVSLANKELNEYLQAK